MEVSWKYAVKMASYCVNNNSLLCAQIGDENNIAFSELIDHFEQIKYKGM